MTTVYKPRRGRRPSTTDWLQILDVDGPFLAAPVVTDTWPDGLPALAQKQMDALRSASVLYDANPGARDAFITHVLTNLLDWRHNLITGPEAAPYAVAVPEHHLTVDVQFALQEDDGTLTGLPLLLGMILPPKTPTTGRAPAGSGTWTAGPADRLAHAMRARKVSLGIVTNGDTWTLVTLSKKDGKDETSAVSTVTWTRHAWLEEPQTLRAFVALLTRSRFYGVPTAQTLPGLLTQSLNRQEEVTERLAEQSQAVVEMLVASIGRLDAQHRAEHGARLLPPAVGPAEVYQAAVTVLMRLVFLLYAEERGLLPLDDDTYASAYAVNTLADSLRDRAADHGEDALERSATGWYRLLALFRGVHRGARHEQLILPAYGGSLFDPDRFPWLEGRDTAGAALGSGDVPAIDDRTLLKALDSLQTLQFSKERRQVSYRSLDVEQIGYVYEGLLDQDALTATDWVVSVAVSDKDPRRNGPELLLNDLEQRHAVGDAALATWLAEQIKSMKGNRSKASILKALHPLDGDDKSKYERLVREACGNDDTVTTRMMPFAKLLRLDPRELPVVYPPGSLYLTDSTARANTGAVYTPRFLAEQVVETTLEAIVHSPGPLDTEDKGKWVLKTPEQILNLKVCDIAAGSGAFLVAATRYLAEKLIESRRQYYAVANALPVDRCETAETEGANIPTRPALREPAQAEQEALEARRAVIVNCIYGVDINPMAIEMAKLSLWLTSLDRNRPFSFLDDHLAVGDSLLGITSAQQLIDLHLDPIRGRALYKDSLDLFTSTVESDLKTASELRAQIPLVGDRDRHDAETKQRLLGRAREITARLNLVADGLTATSLSGGKDNEYLLLAALVSAASTGRDHDDLKLGAKTERSLRREVGDGQHRPAHFPLLFPEVFSGGRDGFDAVIGNPPFLGGGKISGTSGSRYREHLAVTTARGKRAKRPDLLAFFVLTVENVMAATGVCGLVGTNSLSQGDTREIGLDQATQALTIVVANRSKPWPTQGASIDFVTVWLAGAAVNPKVHRLDGARVHGITTTLDPAGRVPGLPFRLAGLRGAAFQGSVPYGAGFILSTSSARQCLDADRSNYEVIKPYLTGDDLYGQPKRQSSRFIIDFGVRGLAAASRYVLPFKHVETSVRPEREALSNKREYERIVTNWWQYWAPRRELYDGLKQKRVGVCFSRYGNTLAFVPAPGDVVFSDSLVVICGKSFPTIGLLGSSTHFSWVERFKSTMGAALRYSITDLYETFVPPKNVEVLDDLAVSLDQARSTLCLTRGIGLTELHSIVQSDTAADGSVRDLRRIMQALDSEVLRLYGWEDLDVPNVLQGTDLGLRWTLPELHRRELVDRLLDLNHELYAAELAAGLHGKGAKPAPAKPAIQAGKGQLFFGVDA